MQYDINQKAVKISALSSGKVRFEYFTGEKILPTDQNRKIEQDKFTYSLFRKAFEKETENNWGSKNKKV